MYFGYSVGLVASLSLAPLMRVFKIANKAYSFRVRRLCRLLSHACGPFPLGLVRRAMAHSLWGVCRPFHQPRPYQPSGHALRSCDRGMVNGLFLSCYYFGGLLGSYIPGALYSGFGWFAATSVFNSSRLPRFSFCSDCTGRHLTCGRTACRLAFRASGMSCPVRLHRLLGFLRGC